MSPKNATDILVIPERRRVLLVIPSLTGGGAERVFSILLRHLDRCKFELHLAVLQAMGPFLQDVPKDVVLHDLKVSRVRYALPSIVRLVRRIRPRAVLSTLGHLNLVLLLAKALFPRQTRLIVREAAVASSVLLAESAHPRLYAFLYRHLYRNADVVVCLSDSMVSDMAEHFDVPQEKLVRIYNRVEAEKVRKTATIGGNPYSGAGPHLVAVGRMTRQKGFDVLIDAMPAILACLPAADLTILGEGPLAPELTSQAQRLGLTNAIHFGGFQENPWRYLKHADLFVLPSRYEGTPNVLLEALALGTKVVASDCPGAIREVRDYHGGMLLVPSEDPQALAEVIVSSFISVPPGFEHLHASNGSLSMFDVQQGVAEYSKLLLG